MISAKEDSVGPFRDIHYVDCKLSIDYTVFYYYRFFFFFFPHSWYVCGKTETQAQRINYTPCYSKSSKHTLKA